MTVRIGRVLRGILETVLDVQSRQPVSSSKAIDAFAHEYRKALKEMRRARAMSLRRGNIKLGPDRIPLQPATSEQFDKYKRQRLAVVQEGDDDAQELP